MQFRGRQVQSGRLLPKRFQAKKPLSTFYGPFDVDLVRSFNILNKPQYRLFGTIQHSGQVRQRMRFPGEQEPGKEADQLFTIGFIAAFSGHIGVMGCSNYRFKINETIV